MMVQSSMDQFNLFPSDPSHGMLFEQNYGVIYQYDASIKAWLKLASDSLVLQLATPYRDGAMAALDYQKLQRIILPPPTTSIIGNDCSAPYVNGTIDLFSGDQFIKVNGDLNIQNIDATGESVSQDLAFQIHKHTYGFNFSLNVANLISELEGRNQIRLEGKAGDRGETGDQGPQGISGILSGPPGDVGLKGTAPTGTLAVELENFQAQIRSGLNKALVDVRLVPDKLDERKYALQFDRQTVGDPNAAASKFIVRQIDSTWVLAIAVGVNDDIPKEAIDCGVPGQGTDGRLIFPLYYVDVAPMVETVRQKYLVELERLAKGYEDIIAYWVGTMADLFDEQKSALCCALENCLSIAKNIDSRQHMESTAASVVGRAKINLNSRTGNQATELSGTRILRQLDQKDTCKFGPQFPKNPAAVFRGGSEEAPSPPTPQPPVPQPPVPQPPTPQPPTPQPPTPQPPTPQPPVPQPPPTSPRSSALLQKTGYYCMRNLETGGIIEYYYNETPNYVYTSNLPLSINGPHVTVRGAIDACTGLVPQSTFLKEVGFYCVKDLKSPSTLSNVTNRVFYNIDGNYTYPLCSGYTVKDVSISQVYRTESQATLVCGTSQFITSRDSADKFCVPSNNAPPFNAPSNNPLGKTSALANAEVIIDPLLHSALSAALDVELAAGRYVATIIDGNASVNGKYRSNVKIRYINEGEKKIVQFIDKGSYDSASAAKSAYDGLTVAFDHDGGNILMFLPSVSTRMATGQVKIAITNQQPNISKLINEDAYAEIESIADINVEPEIEEDSVPMDIASWREYEKSWQEGKCCGIIVNLSGQEYIILKRSFEDDDSCGGGESRDKPYLVAFRDKIGYPAFAWPTLDGKNFAPLPHKPSVRFRYDQDLNDMVIAAIEGQEYNGQVGKSGGVRHLSYTFQTIVFPVA